MRHHDIYRDEHVEALAALAAFVIVAWLLSLCALVD
jgi:hypothetical protein